MPRTEWGWLITEAELRSWILFEDERVLALNKPAHVVCHPSKHGEWSSLIGACRAYLGVQELHLPARLDRETSGVVVVIKDAATRRRVHRAAVGRQIQKCYHAVLRGLLCEAVTVDQPIGLAAGSKVAARRAVVVEGGQAAVTVFEPVRRSNGMTLVRARPLTGRTHQIRVHSEWLGLPVAGDKIYPDEQVFLEFLRTGQPETRQALHASLWQCASAPDQDLRFTAPLPDDFQEWLDPPPAGDGPLS